MTNPMSTEQAIAVAVTTLSDTLPPRQPLTKAGAQGYLIALRGLTASEVGAVLEKALAECKFMPAPAELLALAGKVGPKAMTLRTAEAWEAVRAAMDRYDYTANVDFGPHVNAVIRNLGGWRLLCAKSIHDLVWVRKEFEKLYEAFDGKDMGERGEFLRGEFRDAPVVAVAIGGVKAPLSLPAKREALNELVRELADGKALR
jgi:hypothetical protein